MAKKDKKSAEKKARVAAKQSKKAVQKERKGKGKGPDDSDAEDVDLESVLAEYAEQVSFSCIVTANVVIPDEILTNSAKKIPKSDRDYMRSTFVPHCKATL